MNWIIPFFNSNFLIAIVTLFVGSFAIGIYIRQRREYKRNIAQLIDQEIRYAEQQIINSRIIAQEKYYLAHKLFQKYKIKPWAQILSQAMNSTYQLQLGIYLNDDVRDLIIDYVYQKS